MAESKSNIPPVTKPTSVAVASADGGASLAKVPAHCKPCPPAINLDAPLRWKAANSKEQKLGNGFVTDAYKQLLAAEAFRADRTDGGPFCANHAGIERTTQSAMASSTLATSTGVASR